MQKGKVRSPIYFNSIKSLVNNRPLMTLFVVFFLASVLIFIYLRDINNKSITTAAINSSKNYAEFIKQFRSIYTSEVITKLAGSDIEISHNYQNKQHSVPLPATLSLILSERMKLNGFEIQTKLFSQFPFPWKKKSSRMNDTFETSAWKAINLDPNTPFISIEEVNGILSIRYATADVMRAQCINCHNSHPDSPKTDWKVGDVRGVMEIIAPINIGKNSNNNIFSQTVLLISALLIFGFASFALITNRIQRKNNDLDKLNIDLNDEIKLHKQTEKALKSAKDNAIIAKLSADSAREDAMNANKAKSVFLANISHEIRTPMNAILGYTGILHLDSSLNSDNKKSLHIIKDSGEHLLTLIDDILDLSKLEAGATKLSICNFDLIEVCKSVISMFNLKAEQKKLVLNFNTDISINSLLVNGDQGKLRQVLINLLGNAIKFTHQGEVALSVMMKEESVFSFQVIDTGIGIKDQYQETVFDSFDQGKISSSYGGTGLGLSISKKFLNLMHSKIHLDSEFNHGSSFYFDVCLPIQKKAINVKTPKSNAKQKVADINVLAPKSILIVDDIQLNRSILDKILTEVGFKVFEAKSSLEAQQVLRQSPIDIALTDLIMPDLDGFQLQSYIKKHYLTIPVVAISASTLERDLSYFIDLGFDNYISKPFNFEHIFQVIAESLNIKFNFNVKNTVKISQKSKDLKEDFKLPEAYSKLIIEQCDLYLVKEVEIIIDKLALKFPDNDQ